MLEVEAVNGVTDVQPGETEAALDGTAAARVQFAIEQRLQRFSEATIFRRRFGDRLIQLKSHRGQAELVQLLLQCDHGSPFGNEE